MSDNSFSNSAVSKRPEVSISFPRPVAGTVIEQIFFLSKKVEYIKLYPAIFDRETSVFQLKITRSHTVLAAPMTQVILINPSGQTALFIFEQEKRNLTGYSRVYALNAQELAALQKLMDDLGTI